MERLKLTCSNQASMLVDSLPGAVVHHIALWEFSMSPSIYNHIFREDVPINFDVPLSGVASRNVLIFSHFYIVLLKKKHFWNQKNIAVFHKLTVKKIHSSASLSCTPSTGTPVFIQTVLERCWFDHMLSLEAVMCGAVELYCIIQRDILSTLLY